MYLKVENATRETHDSVSLYFKNPTLFNSIKYKPGQFITLGFQIDDQFEKRAYSFSSSPVVDKYLRVTIKRVEGGLISNYIFNEVKPGHKIKVEKPGGNFYIEPDKSAARKIVLFGAGSGITPIMSICKTILYKEAKSEILLFYGNKNYTSVIFKGELDDLKAKYPGRLRVVHILEDAAGAEQDAYSGMLRKEIVDEVLDELKWDISHSNYFLCGPSGYMNAAREILTGLGIDRAHIKTETFVAPKPASGLNLIDSEVAIFSNGNYQHFKIPGNTSILQGVMKSGNKTIPFSCRSGMCSTCKVKCVEGQVKMTDGHFLSDKEVNEGYILSCISYPVSDKVVIELP